MEHEGPVTMMRGPGRPRSDRDDKTVKIDRSLAEKAQHVALRRKVTLAELLTEMLRKPIEKAYRDEIQRMASEETIDN